MPQQGGTPERDIDDPARLAEEFDAQLERNSAALRAAPLPMETEPPTAFRP